MPCTWVRDVAVMCLRDVPRVHLCYGVALCALRDAPRVGLRCVGGLRAPRCPPRMNLTCGSDLRALWATRGPVVRLLLACAVRRGVRKRVNLQGGLSDGISVSCGIALNGPE